MHARRFGRVIALVLVLARLCCNVQSEPSQDVAAPVAAPSASHPSRESERLQLPDTFDLNGIFFDIILQFTPAKVTDTFPVSPIPDQRLGAMAMNQKLYRMNVCKRADVADCMPSGASNSPLCNAK